MRLHLPSGSLSHFVQLKNGITYPSISGNRDPDNLLHWYWVYSFKQSSAQNYRSRSISVPPHLVPSVHTMLSLHYPISDILSFLRK
jgi:hypothetical protein